MLLGETQVALGPMGSGTAWASCEATSWPQVTLDSQPCRPVDAQRSRPPEARGRVALTPACPSPVPRRPSSGALFF